MLREAPPRSIGHGERDPLALVEGGGDRVGEAAAVGVNGGESIHHHQHLAGIAYLSLGFRVVQAQDGAVDLRAHEPRRPQLGRHGHFRPVGAGRQGKRHEQRVLRRGGEQRVHYVLHRVRFHDRAAGPAVGGADPRPQQAQVVVDLRRGADGRAARGRGVLLLDRHGGGEPLQGVEVRLGHPLQELLGVCGERFDVAALALGVEGVEGQGALARAGGSGHYRKRPPRDLDSNALEIVLAHVAQDDAIGRRAHNLVT